MLNYLDGYDRKEVTLSAVTTVKKDYPVTVASNFTVKNASDGEAFAGICTAAAKGYASVLLSGYTVLPYTGEAPALGCCRLVSDGTGGVKAGENGREMLVVSVDKAASLCGIIL
ncbi:MAG: hypothetical protein IJB74_03890 [Clostridia bacterium]|nr:hypothetical protein [Clostridia bacterium]